MTNRKNQNQNQNQNQPKQEEIVEVKQEGVPITNNSAAPITLIADRSAGGKVTVLPTDTEFVSEEFMKKIAANKAAMSYFNPKALVKG